MLQLGKTKTISKELDNRLIDGLIHLLYVKYILICLQFQWSDDNKQQGTNAESINYIDDKLKYEVINRWNIFYRHLLVEILLVSIIKET